jgi:hypothetical protein
MGTAGFERLAVNGYNLDPAPPPSITLRISLEIDMAESFKKIIEEKLSNNLN